MRLLALDLSTHVGYAFYHERTAVPMLGTWDADNACRLLAQRGEFGALFHAYDCWLQDTLRLMPDVLAFEAPILPRGRTFQKTRAIRMSYGLAEITERIAWTRGLRCLECHPATVKVRLAGHGKARKHTMIAAATRLGLDVATEHEADAVGVALVAYDHVDPPQRELAIAS